MRGGAALQTAFLAVGLAVAAGAQQAEPAAAVTATTSGYDPALLDTCLTLRGPAEDRSGCIGLAAARCLGDAQVIEPQRATDCRQREADQWAARLEAALTLLREGAARSDAAEGAAPGSGRADALESAHTTWLAWREAECGWRQRLAGDSGGDLAALDCRLRESALRALALERLRAEGEGP